jgi:hypothetical protein
VKEEKGQQLALSGDQSMDTALHNKMYQHSTVNQSKLLQNCTAYCSKTAKMPWLIDLKGPGN